MFAMLRDKAEFNPPTAKIDYLEMLFDQRRRERRERRKKEKELSSSPSFGPKGIRASERDSFSRRVTIVKKEKVSTAS